MARVVQTEDATADVLDLGAYIARDNLDAALRLMDSFDRAMRLLAGMPGMGRARPELGPGLRSFPVGNYIIFYRPLSDGIEVVRVLHGARNLRRFFRR